jgi:hypothetical protein
MRPGPLLTSNSLPSQTLRIDHGPGPHDDLANACAGAVVPIAQPHEPRTAVVSTYSGSADVGWNGAYYVNQHDGRSLKMIRGIQTTKIANPQSVPCTIDFRALEAKRQPSLKQNTVGKPQ